MIAQLTDEHIQSVKVTLGPSDYLEYLVLKGVVPVGTTLSQLEISPALGPGRAASINIEFHAVAVTQGEFNPSKGLIGTISPGLTPQRDPDDL